MLIRELFSDAPLNTDVLVSLDLQRLLHEPLNISSDWGRAEQLLLRVVNRMPEQLELKIALYKMYAYAGRFDQSRALIYQVLEQAANRAGFHTDWRHLSVTSAHWENARGAVRLYLYSLKALGFVSLRAGNIPLAHDVLSKLMELDIQDEVGGSVVYDMAESLRQERA